MLCVGARWLHGSTSASQSFWALTSQPAHGTRSRYWALQTLTGGEGMALGGLGLKEWSQVCGWGVRSLFGTEVRDILGNKVGVIGQEGEKRACSVH